MEHDDDLAQMADEIYANGDENTQRRRPIISSEQLDVEAYASLYSGRTKIMRLLFIAERCGNASMQLEALRMAYDEIKKGENAQLFREVVQRIDGRLGTNYGPDPAWADSVDRRAELRKEKLESELNAYRVSFSEENFLLYKSSMRSMKPFIVYLMFRELSCHSLNYNCFFFTRVIFG